jgi:L-ribulokinase
VLGFTLSTKPEEVYRSLIEATAFGTRRIIEAHEKQNITIDEIYACGGLTKNHMLMQIYADVTGREIKIAASSQATALGAAILGAVVAGERGGGFGTFHEAAGKMVPVEKKKYVPNNLDRRTYDDIYSEYLQLHDYFGRGANPVMKKLKRFSK